MSATLLIQPIPILDSHCHLSFLNGEDRAIFSAKVAPHDQWIMGGYDPADWSEQELLAARWPSQVWSSFGLHPWFVANSEQDLETHLKLLEERLPRAHFLGEIGLDDSLPEGKRQTSRQREAFERQLAIGGDKPRVLHVVKAHRQAIQILRTAPGRGLVHAFQGDLKLAHEYLNLGYHISIGPHGFQPHRTDYRELIKGLPLQRLCLESDCPRRSGDRQDPRQVWLEIAKAVAEIRGVSLTSLCEALTKNFRDLLQTN